MGIRQKMLEEHTDLQNIQQAIRLQDELQYFHNKRKNASLQILQQHKKY